MEGQPAAGSAQSSAPVRRVEVALTPEQQRQKAAQAEKGRALRTQGAALEAVRDKQAAALEANKAKQLSANQARTPRMASTII